MLQKHLVILGCGIALSFLLFGCATTKGTSNLQSLIFPQKCENACWMGIEPNISTTDETAKILVDLYGSENVIKDDSGEDSWIISWSTENENWQNRGTVLISNNVVDFVLVWFPDNSMTVAKDIIAEIGNPDSVGLVISGPVVKCAGASLLYPRTGLQVLLSSIDESVGVAETQVVNGFEIHPPWSSENYPWTDTAVISWVGYREYCPEKWSWEE